VLYTAFGSILMLAAVIYLVWALQQTGGVASFAFADLYRCNRVCRSRRRPHCWRRSH
jgi:NADH:ubiquinone oxidoreductase subunit 4 (subunit M)